MFKSPRMEEIFSCVEDKEDAEYFYSAFPDFPANRELEKHLEAVSLMNEKAFLYYLPFFIKCLEEDPMGYDMLIHKVEGGLEWLSDDAEIEYRAELEKIRGRLKAIQKVTYGRIYDERFPCDTD